MRRHHSLGTTPAVAAGLEENPWSLEQVVRNDRRLHAAETLHNDVKPIFTLVAYRRAAKFSDNQTKRADNSYEDREHNRDPHGRELELPELIAQSAPTPTDFI